MEKRGIGHDLDWIIGISLFILYMLFVIVTLKPGVEPLHKGDTLINIIQDRFIQNVSWSITQLELNIKTADCNQNTVYCSLDFPFSYDNLHTNLYNQKNILGIDTFSITESNLYVQSCNGEVSLAPIKFNILYSGEITGTGSPNTPSDTFCTNPSYTYGIPELLTGLSETKIQKLVDASITDYEKLKKDLNYPITNDFNITVSDGTHNFEISKVAPPSNANVYVRQFPEFILKDNGERVPVTLKIEVW